MIDEAASSLQRYLGFASDQAGSRHHHVVALVTIIITYNKNNKSSIMGVVDFALFVICLVVSVTVNIIVSILLSSSALPSVFLRAGLGRIMAVALFKKYFPRSPFPSLYLIFLSSFSHSHPFSLDPSMPIFLLIPFLIL